MGMTVDLSQVRGRIANLSALIKGNEQVILKQISQTVSGAAKDRAPVDEGHLTADIKGEMQEAGGQKAAVIYVPSNATTKDYAIPMHEGDYNLGPLSQAKQAKLGVRVGNKFITRAIDDSQEDMKTIIYYNLTKGL